MRGLHEATLKTEAACVDLYALKHRKTDQEKLVCVESALIYLKAATEAARTVKKELTNGKRKSKSK